MAAHARICQALAGDPSRQLVTMGVTGSFGKTITALMVRSIIEAAGDRCGLVGSLGFCDGSTTRASAPASMPAVPSAWAVVQAAIACRAASGAIMSRARFVPGAAGLAALLAEMVKRRCKGGVLEVSSEALSHRSFDGVAFHAAVVTDVAAPLGFPPKCCCKSAGPRPGSFARSCRAAWRWSMPTIPTPRSWAESTSMRAGLLSLSSRWQPDEEALTSERGSSELMARARGCGCTVSIASWPCTCP